MEIKPVSLSDEDIFQMKRDAERRVREMQRLAQQRVQAVPEEAREPSPAPAAPPMTVSRSAAAMYRQPEPPSPEEVPAFAAAQENPPAESGGPLARLPVPSRDDLLLGLLLLLLAGEEDNRLLMLALGYVLLPF